MTDSFNNFANVPSLMKILDMKQFETMAKINCLRIGIIQSVNGLEAECLITNKKTVGINANGVSEVVEYPPITAKIYYMGNADNNINYPLLIGQPCLLLFNDREFSSYFSTGEVSTCCTDELHSLNYAVCIPLAQPEQDGNFNITTTNNLNITANTANLTANTVNIKATTINIEGSTVNLQGDVYINGLKFEEHTHSNGNMGNPTGSVIV